MPCIEWHDRFSVGVAQFDEHHQHLIGLINKTYLCCVNQEPAGDLAVVMDELIDYVDYHFSAEEAAMQSHDYPGFRPHELEHEKIAHQLRRSRENAIVGADLLTFLGDWLVHHILDVDKQYNSYLKDP